MQVANTILQQLGGGRFIAMTGAKNFVGSDDSLQFALPGGTFSNGINRVRVTLTPADDYRVTAMRVRGTKFAVVDSSEGIYCDNLRDVFERMTGLRTSL